jgi:hypothetical protein
MTSPDDVVAAVRNKQQRDDAQIADLVRRGNLAPARSFADGGMHPTFASAVSSSNVDSEGVIRTRISTSSGTIPANIRTPPSGERAVASRATTKTSTGSVSEPVVRTDTAAAPSSGGGMFGNLFASSSSSQSSSGGMMDRMKSMVGLGGGSTTAEMPAPAPKSKPAPTRTAKTKPEKKEPAKQTANANAGAIRPKSEPAEPPQQQTASTQPSSSQTINGAAPTVPSGGFDNRFGAWR